MSEKGPKRELSLEVELDALPRNGKSFRLEADAAARAAIAARLNTLSVEALSGDIQVTATRSEIAARGVLHAILVRECVASLEPFEERLEERFAIDFRRCEKDKDADDEESGWDAPEIHQAPVLDIGEMLVQQLSLAMDPFPRKPDAKSLAESYGGAKSANAFSTLAERIQKPKQIQ